MDNTVQSFITSPNFKRVRSWGIKRGIIIPNNQESQAIKLIEEFGELCGGVLKRKIDIIEDSVGDMVVVLIGLNKIIGFDLEAGLNINDFYTTKDKTSKELLIEIHRDINTMLESIEKHLVIINYSEDIIIKLFKICIIENTEIKYCFDKAWNEIKDRKGKNIDGNFIKEE